MTARKKTDTGRILHQRTGYACLRNLNHIMQSDAAFDAITHAFAGHSPANRQNAQSDSFQSKKHNLNTLLYFKTLYHHI